MGTCGLPKFLTPIRSGTGKYYDSTNSFPPGQLNHLPSKGREVNRDPCLVTISRLQIGVAKSEGRPRPLKFAGFSKPLTQEHFENFENVSQFRVPMLRGNAKGRLVHRVTRSP